MFAVFVARASFVFAYGPLINAHALVGCMFVCDATIDSFVNCFANLIILLLLAWWFVSFTIYYVCVLFFPNTQHLHVFTFVSFVIAGGASPRNCLVLLCFRTSLLLLLDVTDVIFACPVSLCTSILDHSSPVLPP